jgi:hypothetical protein
MTTTEEQLMDVDLFKKFEKDGQILVMEGDLWSDADKGRPPRVVKVVDIDVASHVARVVNVVTKRMTRVNLDRFRKRTAAGRGYELYQRTGTAP